MSKTEKPRILVLSKDEDESFEWMSNGWFETKVRGTKRARETMARAKECIAKGESVPEVVSLLKEAGFEVFRQD